MSNQDPLADMLVRIKNGQQDNVRTVRMPLSKLKKEVCRVLQEEGYINGYNALEESGKDLLEVELRYYQGKPVIELLKRVSKPSLRVYKGYKELPWVKDGLGVAVVSTAKGVMAGHAARKARLGGEVLCVVA